jgi:hypothetical protein
MGLFNIFRASIRQSKTSTWQEDHRRLATAFSEVRAQMLKLDAQVGTIHMALSRHEDAITGCKDLADRHSKALMQLEQMVSSPPAAPARYTDRPVGTIVGTPALPVVASATWAPAHKLDVDHFSEQQRRLLAVFFQNRDREMSYADVATVLGKSACTVKNQMNQIRHKADLFECVLGPQSRNLFRLKDDLKVEKHLKVGRPMGRPVSIAGSDRSGGEYVTSASEHTFRRP